MSSGDTISYDRATEGVEVKAWPENTQSEPWTGEDLLQRIIAHPERYVPGDRERYLPSAVETILGKYDLAETLEQLYPDYFAGLAERVQERLEYNERCRRIGNDLSGEVIGRTGVLIETELEAVKSLERAFVNQVLASGDQDYPLSRYDAYLLINVGDIQGNFAADSVMRHIDRFAGLSADRELADYMMAHGAASNVLHSLRRFDGVTADRALAEALIDEGNGHLVVYDLDIFNGLRFDQALTQRLIASGKASMIRGHSELFPDFVPDEAFAHILVAQGHPEQVIYDPEAFGVTLDINWMHEVADNGKALDVLRAMELGRVIVPKDEHLAIRLIEQGLGTEVLAHIRNYTTTHGAIVEAVLHTRDHEYLDALRGILDELNGLDDSQCQALSAVLGITFREFPHPQSDSPAEQARLRVAQAYWYADFADLDIGRGWQRKTLGSLVASRIHSMAGEDTLHDATYWLAEFNVPESGNDIRLLKELKAADPGLDIVTLLERSRVTYANAQLEGLLVRQLYHLDPSVRNRLLLTTKDTKLDMMFTDPAMRFIYELLAQNMANDAFFGHDVEGIWELEKTDIYKLAQASFDDFYRQHYDRFAGGELTTGQVDKQRLWSQIQGFLLWGIHQQIETTNGITATIAELQALGERRQQYISDTMTWLMSNGTVHHATLTKAWGDRAMAVAEGIDDKPSAIIAWQADMAFERAVDARAANLPNGITKDVLLSNRWTGWRTELLSVMSIESTIEAISLANRWLVSESARKRLPAARLPVISIRDNAKRQDGQKSRPYSFAILAADDPRGFTIGPKTGCCMTLHGAAESCIKEGYSSPDAGFLSLQMPDGNLGAQSFWYVNPAQPHVLVLDNIEANAGRDMGNVLQLYADGLTAYLTTHPELGITEVYVGEGFSDANLTHLQRVTPVPNPNPDVYTDAKRQRLLLKLAG